MEHSLRFPENIYYHGPVICWSCYKPIDASDHFCRHCGEGQGEHAAWYYHPLSIGLLAVFVMGPFALGLVWKTPRLSPAGRWIATGLIVAYTGYLLFSVLAALRMFRTAVMGAF